MAFRKLRLRMAFVAGTEERYLEDRKPVPGGGHKMIWDGVGEYHAVEVASPDAEPKWNATSRGRSLCNVDVWVLRRVWPNATLPGERCTECERLSGVGS